MRWVSLPAAAIRRPVTVSMLVITVLGLGIVALHKVPLEFLPAMDSPFIRCYIPYPGATPEQVENEIAIPAEGEFRTVSHLKRITTRSDADGCSVHMHFDWDTDMGLATAEVRDRMERLRLRLPATVDQMVLGRFSSEAVPIMAFPLFSEKDPDDFAHLVRTFLVPRLMRIGGVADVTVYSKPEEDVVVEFDQAALGSRNLGIYQIVASLQTSNVHLSAGELIDGGTKYFVRVASEFTRPEDIADLIVGPNGLQLKDVAHVGYQAREIDYDYHIDGKGGVFVAILKESEANTVAVCKALEKELDQALSEPAFKGTEKLMVLNQGELITSSINGLLSAGRYGGVMALVVLFLFLRRLRPTVVVALAIPASLLAGLVFMFFAGMTLNIVTMSAMIIAIGMLVDNSIVVIENIVRYHQLGYDQMESAQRGASEVSMAITAATLTTAVAFIPVLYMEKGMMALYMKQFGGPVAVALFSSLILALTVLPLAVSRMKPRKSLREHLPWYRATLPAPRLPKGPRSARLAVLLHAHPFKRLVQVYIRTLGLVMRWRLATLLLVALLGIATVVVAKERVPTESVPVLDMRSVDMRVDLDPNFDKPMAQELFADIEARIDGLREELGIRNIFVRHGLRGGRFQIYLVDEEDLPPGEKPPLTTEQVRDILWELLPKRLPGAELKFSIAEANQGQSEGSVSLRLRGDDTQILSAYAERLRKLMESVPRIGDVETDLDRDEEEVLVRINEERTEQAGTSPARIARSIDLALRGNRFTYLKQGGREIPVWAQFREEDRKTKANLDNVAVVSDTGELIPINQLVSFDKVRSPRAIRRENAKNIVTVTAKAVNEALSEVRDDLESLIESFDLPPGYSVELGQELTELKSTMTSFRAAVLLAVVLIYIVMATLFESYFLPLSVLTSVPLAFIGVYWAMFITQTPMDSVALVGCILMVGIIVNNGIVIVDHINHLRRNGMARNEAILQGGKDRLRPVMMTALTTILGCVPLGIGGARVSFIGLGRALIGGLAVGTLLTLFVVPLFYSLIDDLQAWTLRYLASLAGIGRGKQSAQDGSCRASLLRAE